MDAIEIGRQRAADLHRLALEGGTDPWSPLNIALFEAQRREIDAESVASGATLLNGGHAVYIASDALILYENVESDFLRAFYIAHEIGHVELGDEVGVEAAQDIDPARSAEASPVGMDRVIDYSRRQRREMQMDIFARELLLPRLWVRRLHLDEGMSATDIASRLGAPFAVVAQQLFDALFLPQIVLASNDSQKSRREPNAMQRAAASHRGSAYLLEAGPGTGKTQTLVTRVAGLLADKVDPRRILLLTFSNKAAQEMAERIAQMDSEAAAAMWVGTFHAFGLDIVRRFHDQLGLPRDIRMLDKTEAVELLEEIFPTLELKHYRNLYDPTQTIADVLSAISRAKDEVTSPQEYEALARTMLERANDPDEIIAAEKALEVAIVYQAYEQLKHQKCCVDFGDLVSMPVRLLESNASICVYLQELYDHVLVDEYQDVNRSSVRLLKALRTDGSNLWVVGDPKQSIYKFRGASSFNLRRFGREDFPDGIRQKLNHSYRSVGEVTAACSAFAAEMPTGGLDPNLTSERAIIGHPPELILSGYRDEQQVLLADQIEAMVKTGYSYSDQAVLSTGNDRMASLAEDLESLGIPILFLGSLFERSEVKDLAAYLSLLVDRRASALTRIACWPEFQMPIADVALILDSLQSDTADDEWIVCAENLEAISEAARSALKTLHAALAGFDGASEPWGVIASLLLDRSRIAARIASATGAVANTQAIAIWQFLNFLKFQPAGDGRPINRVLDRIRRLLRLGDDRDLRQLPAAAQGINAVRLMTIHGAKGLEFPVVHFPGMNKGTMPRAVPKQPCPPPDGLVEGTEAESIDLIKAAHEEEQECLFYVAMSRAEDRLFFYAPTLKKNGHSHPLSPFLDRLGGTLRKTKSKPSRSLPQPQDAKPIGLIINGSPAFTHTQVALYESCPRRFFYTHILAVGGGRKITPFMQMHDAVREVYQQAISEADKVADDTDLVLRVREAITASGLADHGYAQHYEAFAIQLVRYFVLSRQGYIAEPATDLSIRIGDDEIVVRPDDVLINPDGKRILRRVKTGHKGSEEGKDVGSAAFVLAAQQAFPDAAVEMVHLSDEATQPFDLSKRELENRQVKLAEFLAKIRAGNFPADPSYRSCAGCPALFICGSAPNGTLIKNYG